MSPKRILVLGTDAAYYAYTVIALGSFLQHNPRWPVLVMDVGLTPDQARSLQTFARVVSYPREDFHGRGTYIPSAKARCLALAQFPAADTLMLYLDGDTVTLGSVEPLVEQFLASGKSIGIARESDPRFWHAPVGQSWEGFTIPPEFPHGDQWSRQPVLNTGVLLACGRSAAAVGQRAAALYEPFKSRFRFGEQTIINAVLYKDHIDLFDVPPKYHCFFFEPYLRTTGRPYIDPVYLDGEAIVLRHFCHQNKTVLDSLKQTLFDHYAARLERFTPAVPSRVPVPSPPDQAPQLAPATGPVSPDQLRLEEAVRLLARKKVQAKRVLEIGCSAGEAGRRLKETLGAKTYVGIEQSPAAAETARGSLDEVLVADLETTGLGDLGLAEGSFDLLVALDVLGQFRDPAARLSDFISLLRAGGHLLLAVANVQHVSVLLNLVGGRWVPQGDGRPGAAPLRFFTWDSLKELLEGAGLHLSCVQGLLDPPLDPRQLNASSNMFQHGKLTLTGLSREEMTRLFTREYLILARKG